MAIQRYVRLFEETNSYSEEEIWDIDNGKLINWAKGLVKMVAIGRDQKDIEEVYKKIPLIVPINQSSLVKEKVMLVLNKLERGTISEKDAPMEIMEIFLNLFPS